MKGRSTNGTINQIFGWIMRGILAFLLVSIVWVLIYRFVPVPITFTMIGNKIDGYDITKDWMSFDDMDHNMARAVIAGEDGKFCQHSGFDTEAIEKAIRYNARGGKIRGGSTISQQTAKNAFLWQNGGFFRKGLEVWFTVLIETLWSKKRIMEVYLNVAETGMGTYGANAGAMRYFGHDASRLSLTEAGRITAILPDPKDREAINPHGFTRRYGNVIAARAAIVKRNGLDGCLE